MTSKYSVSSDGFSDRIISIIVVTDLVIDLGTDVIYKEKIYTH